MPETSAVLAEPEPVLEEQPPVEEEPVVEDLVIEDLSIDGMCGVY